MTVKDRVAFITGASQGIGRACALALAEGGARVVLAARNTEKLAQVAEEIRAVGAEALAVRLDVSQEEEIKAACAQALGRFERIDILVNNAGIVRDNLLLSMSDAEWRDVIETNLGGVFHCTRAVVKPMLLRRHGRIVNVSSMVSDRFGIGQSNYAASKGGINALTKALARELAPKGITVNAVAPGLIDTDMSAEAVRRVRQDRRLLPRLGRIGAPEDVAPVIVFLASDDARYITGEIIHVDGGLL